LNDKNTEPRTTSWKLVLLILFGMPLVAAFGMRMWLGVPTESQEGDEVFVRMDLSPVSLIERESLWFGNLFFCRMRISSDDLALFRQQLEEFETSRGVPEKPISLKLERAWWDPDDKVEGRFFRRSRTTLWTPEEQPDLFYVVVESEPAGVEADASKRPK
jgi:hypothetical protein